MRRLLFFGVLIILVSCTRDKGLPFVSGTGSALRDKVPWSGTFRAVSSQTDKNRFLIEFVIKDENGYMIESLVFSNVTKKIVEQPLSDILTNNDSLAKTSYYILDDDVTLGDYSPDPNYDNKISIISLEVTGKIKGTFNCRFFVDSASKANEPLLPDTVTFTMGKFEGRIE